MANKETGVVGERRIIPEEIAVYKQYVKILSGTLKDLSEGGKNSKISPADHASLLKQAVMEAVGKIEPGIVFAPWSIPWTNTEIEDDKPVQKEVLESVLAVGIEHVPPDGFRAFLTSDGRLVICENVPKKFRVGTNNDWVQLTQKFPAALLRRIELSEGQDGRVGDLTRKGTNDTKTKEDTADPPKVNEEIGQSQEAAAGEGSTDIAQVEEEESAGVKGQRLLDELIRKYGNEDGTMEIRVSGDVTVLLERQGDSIKGRFFNSNKQDQSTTYFTVGPEGLVHLAFDHQRVEEPFLRVRIPGQGVQTISQIESQEERVRFLNIALMIAQRIQAMREQVAIRSTSTS